MYDISLHILDIVENSIRAGAKNIVIKIIKNTNKGKLDVIIKDDGRGMDKKELKRVTDPFFTTKEGKKIGLGISLFAQAACDTGGKFYIGSKKGKGTIVCVSFNRNHPDMKPLGDIKRTIEILQTVYPDINFNYKEVFL